MSVVVRRALVVVLDLALAVFLWPLAVLFTGIALASLVASNDPPPADGPFMLAVSVSSLLIVAGWIAYVAFCVRGKSPAAALVGTLRRALAGTPAGGS
jgi:hypothetical protein